ncbi:MAG: ATP-binding cassette domain-containing protein [Casimicrobiaceae bacterium]
MAESVTGLPIRLDAVAAAPGGVPVLAGVDLTLAAGRRTVVLGHNGAGKSTLLRVLHGLIPPFSGAITWGNARHRPGGQAMVFQRPVLLRRSAADNIRYALDLAGVRGAEADARIAEALDEVGLRALADRPARVLSGGEQQKLAFARVWALRPEVLFLDEPTASLDPAAARSVEQIIADIHSRGTTIVMTTHNLVQAKRLADDILFLHRGRIIECTPAQEFFAQPRSVEAVDFLKGELL